MQPADDLYQKRFDEDDKNWNGPKLIVLGFFTLLIAVSAIFLMSRTTGCSLQIVP
jgi:hypothetical protein